MQAERVREPRLARRSLEVISLFLASSFALLITVGLSQSADATFAHTPYTGPQIDFTLIQETTQAPLFGPADPEPIWGAPVGVGNSIVFSPTLFTANASAGALNDTHSTLQVHMSALNPVVDPITSITVTESGVVGLTGTGTAGTGAILLMGGTLTLSTISGNEIFTWGGVASDAGPAAFSAGTGIPGGVFFDLISNPGTTNWSGSIVFNTAALLASRGVFNPTTSAVLQYNDQIQGFSEAGSQVTVAKNSASITVVPEPATGTLLMGGLVALAAGARRRRTASCASCANLSS